MAFSRHGYHPVSMQDIADSVGISAPALYRHFPNKYALFAQTAVTVVNRLLDATEEVAAIPVSSPEEAKTVAARLIDEVCSVDIETRATAGIYRWAGLYLEKSDRIKFSSGFGLLGQRLYDIHKVYRPDVDDTERMYLVAGALTALASITRHDTIVARPRLRELLQASAWSLLDLSLDALREQPAAGVPAADAADNASPTVPPTTSRREQLIDASVRLFASHGYNAVTVEQIAGEVALTPSGIYRHFDGKPALLMAAFDRASEWLIDTARAAEATGTTPVERLRSLTKSYVELSFRDANLMRMYFAEQANLLDGDRRRLRKMQQEHLSIWVKCLREVYPDLNDREATVKLYTVFVLIGDQLAMVPAFDDAAAARLIAFANAILLPVGASGPAGEVTAAVPLAPAS
ncbi:TetR family transcriptional regulator [Mycolicibacterium mucogenicum 261Sha1.1M5]|nr:TetR family transcriptional regulator [Mycolicibacterium mucogenicum 261Sha1.1M5]